MFVTPQYLFVGTENEGLVNVLDRTLNAKTID